MITLDEIGLPLQTQWIDRDKMSRLASSYKPTLGGNIHVYQNAVNYNVATLSFEIERVGKNFSHSLVLQLKALANERRVMPFHYFDESYNAVFYHGNDPLSESQALTFTTVFGYLKPGEAFDIFTGSIKLMIL